MLKTLFAILLVIALAVPWHDVAAQEACVPTQAFPAKSGFTVEVQSDQLGPVLSARLAIPWRLRSGAPELSELGLGDGKTSTTLTRRVIVAGYPVIDGMLVNNAATLSFADGKGHFLVRIKDRIYALDVHDRKAYDARQNPVTDVLPAHFTPLNIVLPVGTHVVATGDGGAQVDQGSVIAWELDAANAPPLSLVNSAVLREANALQSTARVTGTEPRRALPGSKMRFRLHAGDADLGKASPWFCFSLADDAAARIIGVQGNLVAREGDTVIFETTVPEQLGSLAAHAQRALTAPWFAAFYNGTPVHVRIVAPGASGLLVDASADINLSSRAKSAAIALLVTVGTLFVLARLCSKTGFIPLFGNLFMNQQGRYSLSNVQVFLWTVLVLFSLFYVWRATGEVLAISSGMLILLGTSGGTLATARLIESQDGTLTKKPAPPEWRDLIMSDGKFDVPRYQMLAFTLFTWVYALAAVVESEGLPEIPESLYILMGISNATYVAGKLPGVLSGAPATTVATTAATTSANTLVTPGTATADPISTGAAADALKALQARLNVALTGILDHSTLNAIVRFKQDHSIIPASPTLNADLTQKILQVA